MQLAKCSFHLGSADLLLEASRGFFGSFKGSFFGGHGFFYEIALGLLHRCVGLETSLTDVVVVDESCTQGGGVEEPDEEGHLDGVV